MRLPSIAGGRAGHDHRTATERCVCKSMPLRTAVYLVDVEPRSCEIMTPLPDILDVEFVQFHSIGEYADCARNDEAACLILNLSPRNQAHFEIECELAAKGSPPVIFLCDHSDISAAVRALKAGAVEVLTSPVGLVDVAQAVAEALEKDRRQRHQNAVRQRLQQRHERLTPREREVLPLVARGLMNKQAAELLSISETTLQIHRSHVMRKMQAESVVELVRMANALQIPIWSDSDLEPKKGRDFEVMAVPDVLAQMASIASSRSSL